MAEITAFFHMGGYAAYVWPALIISFVVLLANVLISRAQLKQAIKTTAIRSKARAESDSTSNVKTS